jgi:hypothetical protein
MNHEGWGVQRWAIHLSQPELIGTSHDLLNPTVITLRAPQPHEQHSPRHGAFLRQPLDPFFMRQGRTPVR